MNSSEFSTAPSPLIIGHRGVSGHYPENSIAAFRAAAAADSPFRCDGVELDIHTTSDGCFVVHHDAVLGSGELISRIPLSRLRATQLPDGTPVPTLEEALGALSGLRIFVEAKGLPPTADVALLHALQGGAAGRWQLHSFDHRIIARIHRIDPSLSLGVLSSSYPIDPVRQVTDAGADTLWQSAELIDRLLVESCRLAGVGVIAWTVNDPAEASRLAALGVTGLCGNWPERLRPNSTQ